MSGSLRAKVMGFAPLNPILRIFVPRMVARPADIEPTSLAD
jgi:hypothetical protein